MPSTRWIIEMRLPVSSTPSVLNSTVVLGVRRSALPSSNSISRDRGRAEIEFEDGSALRLTPNTTVEFSTLGVDDSGKRISMIHLVEGMAYVNWLGKDEFSMNFSRETIALDRGSFPGRKLAEIGPAGRVQRRGQRGRSGRQSSGRQKEDCDL